MHYGLLLGIKGLAILAMISSALLFAASYTRRGKKLKPLRIEFIAAIILSLGVFIGADLAFNRTPSLDFFMRTVGPAEGPQLPILSAVKFLSRVDTFREVDISRSPADLPQDTALNYLIEAEEVLNEIAPGVWVNSWTFNGSIPGPFLRAKVGDSVTITLRNKENSLHTHSLDLHAVTGPGGGANVLQVAPGEEKSLTFLAKHPGLYIYHCASPNVGVHMAHGMYGLILIEAAEGLGPVDKEFYVVQGETYSSGAIGTQGLQSFDSKKYLSGDPTYVFFNGKLQALDGKMQAQVGDRIRIYVGNGGVNLVSNFHVIGEIFDTVYPESGTPVRRDVQTTVIPAGGAAIVEFVVDLPGRYILVDHALARMDKGAWGVLEVSGEWDDTLYSPRPTVSMKGH